MFINTIFFYHAVITFWYYMCCHSILAPLLKYSTPSNQCLKVRHFLDPKSNHGYIFVFVITRKGKFFFAGVRVIGLACNTILENKTVTLRQLYIYIFVQPETYGAIKICKWASV